MSTDHLVDGLLGKIGESTVESFNSRDSTSNKAIVILISSFTALLLITGCEAFKVLFRKNIGKDSISFRGVFISVFFYFLYACFLYHQYSSQFWKVPVTIFGWQVTNWSFTSTFLVGAILYLALGILTLILGIIEYFRDNKIHPLDRGESFFFNFLLYKKFLGLEVNKMVIWFFIEPLAIMLICMLLYFNPLLMLPLTMQTLIFALNEYFHVVRLIKMEDHQHEISIGNENKIFHRVRIVK